MAAPVTLITVHHEGAGSPCTAAQSERCASGGYTFSIGTDTWRRFRTVWESYATLNYNHVSLDLVLPGNRMDFPVTDHDLTVIAAATAEARRLGYVTDFPQVRAHRNSPGSSTVCPGNFTMDRWGEVEAACMADAPPVPTPTPPEDDMPVFASAVNQDTRPELFVLNVDGSVQHRWRNATGGTWVPWQPFGTGPFDSLTAFTNDNGCLEVMAHHVKEGTMHRWQTAPNGPWSDWVRL